MNSNEVAENKPLNMNQLPVFHGLWSSSHDLHKPLQSLEKYMKYKLLKKGF